MKIVGERTLDAPIDTVWERLFDVDVLRLSIPGCESVTRESDSVYKAVTVMAIGPLKARFAGSLTIADADPPHRCTLLFEGVGGAAGVAKGAADIVLVDTGNGTRLTYEAEAQISGKLAQVGARLIDGVARKLAAEFFDRFETAVAAQQ